MMKRESDEGDEGKVVRLADEMIRLQRLLPWWFLALCVAGLWGWLG
jgi:hypothetical protein